MLRGQQKTLIVSHRSIIRSVDAAISRARDGVRQVEDAALVGIGGRRTGTGGSEAVLTGDAIARDVDCRIGFAAAAPQVRGFVAEVTDRSEPCANLPLIR